MARLQSSEGPANAPPRNRLLRGVERPPGSSPFKTRRSASPRSGPRRREPSSCALRARPRPPAKGTSPQHPLRHCAPEPAAQRKAANLLPAALTAQVVADWRIAPRHDPAAPFVAHKAAARPTARYPRRPWAPRVPRGPHRYMADGSRAPGLGTTTRLGRSTVRRRGLPGGGPRRTEARVRPNRTEPGCRRRRRHGTPERGRGEHEAWSLWQPNGTGSQARLRHAPLGASRRNAEIPARGNRAPRTPKPR